MTRYDYIIIGAGAAGLMLADALGKDSFFKNTSILLLDKDTKNTNDRTWCFWEKGKGEFDPIVSKTWNHIYFGGQYFSKRFKIAPYTYKMIRGIDFYNYYLNRISNYPNISFQQENVIQVKDDVNHAIVSTNKTQYAATQVFNSIFDYGMTAHQDKYPVLQQHFVGWFIKTDKPIFDTDQATYMDFSVPQKGNTRFMYILPLSKTEALVEYTLFSEKLLPKEAYEKAIQDYIVNDLGCKDYEVLESEKGSIPMTCYDFKDHHTSNMRYIGTAGGWAKPSTGYTFMSTARKIPKFVAHLKTGKPLADFNSTNRFWYYDLLLLDVLAKNNGDGHHIFESLFQKRDPQLIFKFLDEETSLIEDLNYILGCPQKPFLKALFRRLT